MIPVPAEPFPFSFDPAHVALLCIDFQRDFVEPGGFGESLGNDVSRLRSAIEPTRAVLAAFRDRGWTVIHTREGHRPDLTDLFPAKRDRGNPSLRIGEEGPMGRLLVRGSAGHDIVPELAPLPGEVVLDKPGKGSFYATDLETILRARDITHLVVTGVTTEVCVQSTVREANDRGFESLILSDCTGSYFPEFHESALAMFSAQGAIVGWVSTSADLLAALDRTPDTVRRARHEHELLAHRVADRRPQVVGQGRLERPVRPRHQRAAQRDRADRPLPGGRPDPDRHRVRPHPARPRASPCRSATSGTRSWPGGWPGGRAAAT